MKKLLPIIVLSALVLAACSPGGGAVAASVDGSEITVGDVERLIETEESTIPKDQFAQFLGFRIQWNIIEAAASADFGIEVTEGEISEEADRIFDTTNAGETREEFVASRGVTEDFLLEVAHQNLIDQALVRDFEENLDPPSQADIDEEMAVSVGNLTTVCVSHILVATEDEADDAYARVTEGGEEFGAVATEVSQDPGSAENDGILPCGPAGSYVPEFRDASLVAPIGEVYSEIVGTQFGFHIMLVTDRTDPDESELPTEESITAQLTATASREAVNNWFFESVAAADVTVGEDYGTWNPEPPQPGVVPPTG